LEVSDVSALATAAAASAKVGDFVASVVEATGLRGSALVLVEEGNGFGLEFEIHRGTRLDLGYASSRFVTDTTRRAAVLEDAVVLLVGGRLGDVRQLLRDMKIGTQSLLLVCSNLPHVELAELVGMRRNVVVVAGATEDVLERLQRLVGGAIQYTLLVDEPRFQSSLGRAAKVVVTERDMVVFAAAHSSGAGDNAAVVRAEAADVAKVERAVRAVHSAAQEGVLRGGGVGLADIGARLAAEATGTPEETAGWQAFAAALSEPSRHIAENAALTVPDLDPSLLDSAGAARTIATAAAHTAARFLLIG
jgi:chaperonin GroEL